MTDTDTTDAATAAAVLPAEWSALLIPYDIPSTDGRLVPHPDPAKDFAALHRPLPLPLRWAPGQVDTDAPAGMHGVVVGQVTNLTLKRTMASAELWGHGTLDLSVPGFAELVAAAWRTRAYTPGLSIGVDLDDVVTSELEDGPERALIRFDAFRLIGVTINTGPVWPNTRLVLTPPPTDDDDT